MGMKLYTSLVCCASVIILVVSLYFVLSSFGIIENYTSCDGHVHDDEVKENENKILEELTILEKPSKLLNFDDLLRDYVGEGKENLARKIDRLKLLEEFKQTLDK